MKVGDLITLSDGPRQHFKIISKTALLVKKLPRSDRYEYDWLVLADGRFIGLGRQLEDSEKILSESR
jgi:hypothetical protein